jgi:D-alanyl-D-alanine carboxypeptidase/D-alanyl-D-alanine-endopeptidase (penicillin-binding protein 4)
MPMTAGSKTTRRKTRLHSSNDAGETPLCVTSSADPDTGPVVGLSQDGPVKRPVALLALTVALVSSSVALVSSSVALAPAAIAAPPASTEQAEARINARITARIDNPRFGSDVAVAVLDAASGRVIFSRKADRPMLPASNMKIVTAVTTVAAVGPDRTFRTAVFAGPGAGEIILQGGGDPLLTSSDVRSLASDVALSLDPASPVTVSSDLNLFAPPSRAPGWPRGYIPSVAASVSPLARLGDYSTDPAASALQVFRQRLKALGFTVQAGSEVDVAPDAAPLAEVSRHSAADAVRIMLRESENNVAEVLFRHVAIAKGQPATWEGARTAAAATLAELGIDTAGLAIVDGSGLSRKDRLTALALANVTRLSSTGDPARFAVMYDASAMPISGVSGTLDSKYGRFTTKHSRCARAEVRAKTGTLFDTIGLSGVTTATDGQQKAFSILVNDRPQRFTALATRQAADGLAATVNGCW